MYINITYPRHDSTCVVFGLVLGRLVLGHLSLVLHGTACTIRLPFRPCLSTETHLRLLVVPSLDSSGALPDLVSFVRCYLALYALFAYASLSSLSPLLLLHRYIAHATIVLFKGCRSINSIDRSRPHYTCFLFYRLGF